MCMHTRMHTYQCTRVWMHTHSILRQRDINRGMATGAAWSLGLWWREAVALMLMSSDDLEQSLN